MTEIKNQSENIQNLNKIKKKINYSYKSNWL